jgi:Spy/CpxP family protein refolding chaperone
MKQYFLFSVLLIMAFSVIVSAQPGDRPCTGDKEGPKMGAMPMMGHGFVKGMEGCKRGQGANHYFNLPNLTDGQKANLDELRLAHQKAVLPLRNLLGEKQAHLMTVRTEDKADLNKINQVVDEIGAVKVKLAKEREAYHQNVRKILTEEQRLIFDMRPMKGGPGKHCINK